MFVPGGRVQVKQSLADRTLGRPPKVVRVNFVSGRTVYTDQGVYRLRDLEVGDRSEPPRRAEHPFGSRWPKPPKRQKSEEGSGD